VAFLHIIRREVTRRSLSDLGAGSLSFRPHLIMFSPIQDCSVFGGEISGTKIS